MAVCCIGYIILLAQYKPAVSYFATFLCVAGVSPCIALAIVWVGGQFGPVVSKSTSFERDTAKSCILDPPCHYYGHFLLFR